MNNPAGHRPADGDGGIRPGWVTLSRNETESLCMKAARGAGFSWGLAEEAGFAAGWLAARGIDGTGPLLTLIGEASGQPADFGMPRPSPGFWQSGRGEPLCPIHLGTALLDHAALADGPFFRGTQLDPVAAPLLLLPFLVRSAQICDRSLAIEWRGGTTQITPQGAFDPMTAVNWANAKALALTITASSKTELASERAAPTNLPAISQATLDGLNAFALRTTVPATDASRGGAGSVTTDND
jgi:hypothetical protein